MLRLENRTALVTGGTQGVGAAIAKSLARAGCHVILQGLRDNDYARATLDDCRAAGASAHAVFADLSGSTSAAVERLLHQVDGVSQRVDILVNNAGTYCDEPFLEMSLETFERTMRLNVYAGYFLTQAYSRRWIANGVRGRVLFTGSINGELAEADHTAYDTSKGAVRMMVRSLCVALAPYGIRVNSMAPGLVVTPLTAGALADQDDLRWMELHTPNGIVPGPEACGSAALFLLSDEAEHVHGQTLLVDGGMSVWQQPALPNELRGKLSPRV